MSVDDPSMTVVRRELSKTKRGLYLSYLEWYREFEEADKAAPPGVRVELGSGGGFLEQKIPSLIKTDLLPLPFVDLICRGEQLPFAEGSVGAMFMINVLHHIPSVERFFAELQRVLRPAGRVAMIEPFVTPLSRLIYGRFHPEPFEPEAESWEIPPSGPLSGGNDALPWIVFVRDRAAFEEAYPDLEITTIRPQSPFLHFFSGGVMLRGLVPGPVFPLLRGIDGRCSAWLRRRIALFATIEIRKASGAGSSR